MPYGCIACLEMCECVLCGARVFFSRRVSRYQTWEWFIDRPRESEQRVLLGAGGLLITVYHQIQIAPSSSPRGAAYVAVVPVVLTRGSSRRAFSQAALTLSGEHTSGATV